MKLELCLDHETMVDSIFRGEFALGPLTLDQMVDICNVAVNKLTTEPESEILTGEEIENFSLWLGGINKDIQVYAWQLIRRVKEFGIVATDKMDIRICPLEDFIFSGEPYEASDFRSIRHFAWPKIFADGSTFEERFQELAKEYSSAPSPADMLLSGTEYPEDLDFNQRFQLANDCVDELVHLYDKYGKSNILLESKIERFFGWLLTIEDDIALFSILNLIGKSRGKVQFDSKNAKRWDDILERWSGIISKFN